MSLIFSAIQSHHLGSEVLGVLTCFDEIQFNQAKYTLLVTMTFPLVSWYPHVLSLGKHLSLLRQRPELGTLF